MKQAQVRWLWPLLLFALSLTGCPAKKKEPTHKKKVKKSNTPTSRVAARKVASKPKKLKLYWLIPDGVRAEPDVFKLYQWAREGKLPNLKKMLEKGSYGYSKPFFPTHTPVNFASLLTGTSPKVHGVADGPMHIENYPLSKVSVGGFRSVARKIDAVWTTLEKQGRKVAIVSTPGSTPPEISKGVVIRGRWGGWGADVHAINFERLGSGKQRRRQARGVKLFFFGPPLTRYLKDKRISRRKFKKMFGKKSARPALKAVLKSWGAKVHAYVYATSRRKGYDRVLFSADDKTVLADLKQGEWGKWVPVKLSMRGRSFDSHYRFHVIRLGKRGFYRLRIFYNNINKYLTLPSSVAADLTKNVGPMMDFVDNFPPQLIYYPEDKSTFLSELHKTFDWHVKAIPYIWKKYQPDVVIHDIYSPNQLLTSRWWLGHVDPTSRHYKKTSKDHREKAWKDILGMYKRIDDMLGKILKTADKNTLVVLSSDHGACALNRWVRLNNLFAKKGWLKFKVNRKTGIPTINWKKSKVVYLKMDSVYIHPKGLGGKWKRASGKAYEKLRAKVTKALKALKDKDGTRPVTSVVKWEDAKRFHKLPPDRVGDLVISNKAGYGWNEEVTKDRRLFDNPLKSGYKQSILVKETKAMWTPFVVMGPGIKKNYKLKKPISHMDQLPTLLKAIGAKSPTTYKMEGVVLKEIFVK
jgi:predicted AlkP superfamily phosphohydrolase/phosphomutase